MPVQYSKVGRVFDLLPEAIFVLDKDGKVIDNNIAAARLLSGDGGEVQLETIFEIMEEPSRTELLKAMHDSKAAHELKTQFFLPPRKGFQKGRIADVELTLKKFDTVAPDYYVLITKDITEQQKRELDLLRFSEVIHHTVNPIEITDAKGKIIYVNPAFERVTGYSREEIIGKNPNMLSSGIHGKDFWYGVWDRILSGKEWVGQIQNRRKDGRLFHTELVISPIIDSKGVVVGFLGAHRDITEQKMLEQQLVRSQKMETFGTLAAGIAHEVGNPLTSISSLVQVIQRTTKDKFAQDKLELVKNQVNRIAKIIRELVDFSRPSAYEIKHADANAILRDALNIVQYGKKVHDITFATHFDDDLPLAYVVPDQLVQVYLNILMNAVDACEGRAGTISVFSQARKNMIEVRITDTGKGIAEHNMDKIFDPFFTTKEVGKGTGLGLWVSYGIMKNFGGDIVVESKEGEGSTFTVVLPLSRSKGIPSGTGFSEKGTHNV
ncbi:MAG: PAS domain S-box protein [Bacteroidota bacterium]|nr:PAS domain S-box protein [Bacteroidota bacterium]